ncbi:MAG: hypothetical protein HQK64_09975 [Desulfamplus sp.]|nr:hypothetical protein [Desulfamplus sp.]MBF0242785.1 hypothetical protein [Desulfamplus sp.]
MYDISVSYNKYKFLGNEFLTWLWYLIENDINIKKMAEAQLDQAQIECNSIVFEIGNCIALENSLGDDSIEKISIKGDDAGLEEGKTALKKGAVVTDMNLVLRVDDNEWRFNLKGESLELTSLKTPVTGKVTGEDDTEGAVLEKVFLYNMVFEVIDILFYIFIKKRASNEWKTVDISEIQEWVEE